MKFYKVLRFAAVIKYPAGGRPLDDRTNGGLVEGIISAASKLQPVHGVKGLSIMLSIPDFRTVWGLSPDYLHSVLLGVGRQVACLFLK